METNNWVPVKQMHFPEDKKDVQVTFIGYNDHEPHCEAFAYRNDEDWYWSLDDAPVKEIGRASCRERVSSPV